MIICISPGDGYGSSNVAGKGDTPELAWKDMLDQRRIEEKAATDEDCTPEDCEFFTSEPLTVKTRVVWEIIEKQVFSPPADPREGFDSL